MRPWTYEQLCMLRVSLTTDYFFFWRPLGPLYIAVPVTHTQQSDSLL
jgi:hypothetical protein